MLRKDCGQQGGELKTRGNKMKSPRAVLHTIRTPNHSGFVRVFRSWHVSFGSRVNFTPRYGWHCPLYLRYRGKGTVLFNVLAHSNRQQGSNKWFRAGTSMRWRETRNNEQVKVCVQVCVCVCVCVCVGTRKLFHVNREIEENSLHNSGSYVWVKK